MAHRIGTVAEYREALATAETMRQIPHVNDWPVVIGRLIRRGGNLGPLLVRWMPEAKLVLLDEGIFDPLKVYPAIEGSV